MFMRINIREYIRNNPGMLVERIPWVISLGGVFSLFIIAQYYWDILLFLSVSAWFISLGFAVALRRKFQFDLFFAFLSILPFLTIVLLWLLLLHMLPSRWGA
jgi:hypothetical protein